MSSRIYPQTGGVGTKKATTTSKKSIEPPPGLSPPLHLSTTTATTSTTTVLRTYEQILERKGVWLHETIGKGSYAKVK